MKKNKKLPVLSFENYFSSDVTALRYMTLFFPIKRIKDLKILFSGKFSKGNLVLKEKYQDNNTKVLRIWSFKKTSNNNYIGKENNVKGDIIVSVNENKLNMHYKFKTNYKKFFFSINVQDSMYLVDKNKLINKTVISKYGLRIAESFLVYKKS